MKGTGDTEIHWPSMLLFIASFHHYVTFHVTMNTLQAIGVIM